MVKIAILLLFSFAKCDKVPYKRYSINLENHSSRSIGGYFGLGGNFGTMYPDTSLPINDRYLIKEIKAGNKFIYYSGIKWEEIFEQLPQDTLSIFIFDIDTLHRYNWEIIRERYKVLQRYDLSYGNLKDLDFQVPYPPNEWMKEHVKIYP